MERPVVFIEPHSNDEIAIGATENVLSLMSDGYFVRIQDKLVRCDGFLMFVCVDPDFVVSGAVKQGYVKSARLRRK
jgi:hypothetical protein